MIKRKNIFLLILKRLKKRIKLRTLLFLALTISANSYAWFIYATKVNNDIEAHVRAWNVSFEVNSTKMEEYITFDVGEMYPGMAQYTDRVTARNSGESLASLTYEVISARIMNDVYVVGTNGITSESLLLKLANDYPFSIVVTATNNSISPNGGEAQFVLTVSWPYESGNDAVDTFWGNNAYDYHLNNPTSPFIAINIKISAIQV